MRKSFRQLLKKNGYVSILVIFMVGFTMPFFMFYFVELNHLYTVKDKYQAFADSAASGAVMQLERGQIQDGKLVLDEDEAREVAEQLLARNYNLTDDLHVTDDSLTTETPVIKIYTVGFDEEDDANPTIFTTDEGFVYNINHPTVIVYTETKPRGIFYSQFVGIQTISAYEVSYKTGTNLDVDNTPQMTSDGLVLVMNRLVNPISFPESSSLFPMDLGVDPLPMAAGGNMELSIVSTNPDVVLNDAIYELRIGGGTYSNTLSRSMTRKNDFELSDTLSIPEDAPIGATVTLDFKDVGITVTKPSGTELKGNADFGFANSGKQIGSVETNIFKLVRIQKKYQE